MNFFERTQGKVTLKKKDLKGFRRHATELRTTIPIAARAIEIEQENARIIENVLNGLRPKPNTAAHEYLVFLKKKRIPALKHSLDYLGAINAYFAFIEYTESQKIAEKTKEIDLNVSAGTYEIANHFGYSADYNQNLGFVEQAAAGVGTPPRRLDTSTNLDQLIRHNAASLRQHLVKRDARNRRNGLVNLNVFRVQSLKTARTTLQKNGIEILEPKIFDAFKGATELNAILGDTSDTAIKALPRESLNEQINTLSEHNQKLLYSMVIDEVNIRSLNGIIFELIQTGRQRTLLNQSIRLHDVMIMRKQYYANLQEQMESKLNVLYTMMEKKNELEGISAIPKTPQEKVQAKEESLDRLELDIKQAIKDRDWYKEHGRKAEAEFYEKRLKVLENTGRHLHHAYLARRTGAEAYIENAREMIKEGHFSDIQNLQVAMEEYIAVKEELRAQGKLPDNEETQSFLITAAISSNRIF